MRLPGSRTLDSVRSYEQLAGALCAQVPKRPWHGSAASQGVHPLCASSRTPPRSSPPRLQHRRGGRASTVRSTAHPGLRLRVRPNQHARRACRRGAAGRVQRAQRAQQVARRPQRVRRRRVQPPQAVGGFPAAPILPTAPVVPGRGGLAGVPPRRVRQALRRLAQHLPGRRHARRAERQRQRQRRQVGVEDLRPRRGRQRGALGPQPQAQARPEPACGAAASAPCRRAAGRPSRFFSTRYVFTQQGAAGDGEADTTKLHALTQQGPAGDCEADTTIHSRAVFLVCPAARPAPARPRRWSAAAAETRTVRSRLRPVPASCSGRRASPASTTARTPATVSDASAMGVASTMRRAPARPARAASPCAVSGWRLQQQQICSARSASLTCMHVQLQTQLVSARLPPARHWPLHTDVLGACTRDKAATYSHAPCGECTARERKRPPPQVAAAAPCAATARPRPPGRRTVGLREHGGVLRRRREVAVEWADARVGRHAPRQQPRHPAHLPPAGAARASHARMYTHAAGSLWAAAERTVAKHTALLDSASVVLLEQQAEPAA